MKWCWILVSNSEHNLNGPRCKGHGCQWSLPITTDLQYAEQCHAVLSLSYIILQCMCIMDDCAFSWEVANLWSPLTNIVWPTKSSHSKPSWQWCRPHKTLRADLPVCRLPFIISVSPTSRISIQQIQLNYSSLQPWNQVINLPMTNGVKLPPGRSFHTTAEPLGVKRSTLVTFPKYFGATRSHLYRIFNCFR